MYSRSQGKEASENADIDSRPKLTMRRYKTDTKLNTASITKKITPVDKMIHQVNCLYDIFAKVHNFSWTC